jgi:hypothetical protein
MTTKTIIASVVLLAAIPAGAGTTIPHLTEAEPVATTESGWRFSAALYGWATGLDGDITIKERDIPVDVGFGDVLNHLDFAAMGVVQVRRDKWSFVADLFYAKLGAENSKGDIDFDAGLDQFVGNFMVMRNVLDTGCTHLDAYAGARLSWMDATVDIDFPNIQDRSFSHSGTWVDPIIGVRFQQDLSDKFFFRTLGDIGGFGIASDLTWQGFAAFGYRVNDKGSVLLGYRGIGTDYSDGGFSYDVTTHGLLLGFEYMF